jgi:hypothetical protein
MSARYKVGDAVVFVNCYGINWGTKKIVEVTKENSRGWVYLYEPTDTPWFRTEERRLFDPKDEVGITEAERVGREFAKTDLMR